MIVFHVHEGCLQIGLAVIIPPSETGCMPVVDCLMFQKTPKQFPIPLVPSFPFPRPCTKTIFRSMQTSSRKRQIFWRSAVLVSSVTVKDWMCSRFTSSTDSRIFRNIFSSHFPTDFFQTKVYLLAHASSFVPSMKTVSFDNLPAFSRRFTIW